MEKLTHCLGLTDELTKGSATFASGDKWNCSISSFHASRVRGVELCVCLHHNPGFLNKSGLGECTGLRFKGLHQETNFQVYDHGQSAPGPQYSLSFLRMPTVTVNSFGAFIEVLGGLACAAFLVCCKCF